jgi:hypothetical protein
VKAEIRFAGHKAEEIKIALQAQFPYIGIKAQVSPAHYLVVGVVRIGIAKLRKIGGQAHGNVVAKFFRKKIPAASFGRLILARVFRSPK